MNKVKILWKQAVKNGSVRASNGTVCEGGTVNGTVALVGLSEAAVAPGPCATVVHVEAGAVPFSFFLRDVTKENPIYVPVSGAVVTTADDARSFETIVEDIKKAGGRSVARRVEEDTEYNFARAAGETRDSAGVVWLGVSKDMRIFQLAMRGSPCGRDLQTMDEIRPTLFFEKHTERQIPELKGDDYALYMMTGRGIGCRDGISKRLEDGCLPILHVTDRDGDMIYRTTYFATLEKSPLKTGTLRGTDMYVADAYGCGHMQTPAQRERTDAVLEQEVFARDEEVVLYVRTVAENTTKAPAYGFLRIPDPLPNCSYAYCSDSDRSVLDPQTGFLCFASSGRVAVIAKLNGKPVPAIENSVLIPAGGKAVFTFMILHTPVSPERAAALANNDFDARLREAKAFWQNELAGSAQIELPEKRVEEMLKAGLLHMDLGYFGKNPDQPVVPIVGRYTAIGSESAPCIQFLDAMGLHGLTERALRFFAEKQHENGFMQNFGGYMLETGSVLWTMGEHWRMTRNEAWVRSVKDTVLKAADFLIRWREENLDEALKGGNGYGMIKGKVADPEDHFHSFMLNSGAYAGLRAAAEMLACCDPENAARIGKVAAEMRENIRESFGRNLALSPVIPAADGTWLRSCSTWTEDCGPLCLYVNGGRAYTHGSFMIKDILGANYLVMQGVFDPEEPTAAEISAYFTEFLTLANVAFSQPYYSPHPYIQLCRGDVKLFLQEFYCGFAGLADRGTYSFWEHYFFASPHKLHEEGWFLMRCRWMLALERYHQNTLSLLAGVPREWLKDGKTIAVKNLKTYYGTLCYSAESRVADGVVHIKVQLDGNGFAPPETLTVRVPHPDGLKATRVTAGTYDPVSETVTITAPAQTVCFDVLF